MKKERTEIRPNLILPKVEPTEYEFPALFVYPSFLEQSPDLYIDWLTQKHKDLDHLLVSKTFLAASPIARIRRST